MNSANPPDMHLDASSSQPRFDEQLDAAIEGVYAAFQRYRLKSLFEDRCSPLGRRPEVARALQNGSLRGLRVEDLALYAFKAMSTMGDTEDFKHFLPRMLELHALEPEWHRHNTNLFAKLAELHWRDWAPDEQTSLENYLSALWQSLLQTYPEIQSARDFYADIRTLGIHFSPFLEAWHPPRSVASLRHLAKFVGEYLRGASEFEGPVREIDQWLLANDIESVLEQAFFAHLNESFASELSDSADCFRWRQV